MSPQAFLGFRVRTKLTENPRASSTVPVNFVHDLVIRAQRKVFSANRTILGELGEQ